MFKVIHILDDDDIRKGLKYLRSRQSPPVILLDIQGKHFLFSTTEAIEMMEDALDESTEAETRRETSAMPAHRSRKAYSDD